QHLEHGSAHEIAAPSTAREVGPIRHSANLIGGVVPNRILRRSIRFRLMAWNTGVVLVMALAALCAVREGLRLTLLGELDERLREDTVEVQLAVEQFYPRLEEIRKELDRKAIGHKEQEMFIQLVDQQGRVLLSS